MQYGFENFVLDLEQTELRRDGQTVHVEPQVFDVLVLFAKSAGKTISKVALVESVWNGLAVSDATINARISAARHAIDDSGTEQRVIRTVHRRGYRFVAPVSEHQKGAAGRLSSAATAVNYVGSQDGAAIAWAEDGQGPTIIRIGHWLSHLELDRQSLVWGPLLDRLSANHRLVRYDLRGTGLSSRDASLEGIDGFVEDLLAVADASNSETFTLFGASQAVPVAIEFAARHPGRVENMVLYGGYAIGRALRPDTTGQMDEATALAMIRAGWGKHGSAFLKAFSTLYMPDATPQQVEEFGHMQMETVDVETAVTLRRVIDHFDVRDRLKAVDAPALVLHGQEDSIHPLSQGKMLAAGIKNAHFMELDCRNHIPLPQMPSWTAMMAEVDSFLAR